MTLPALTRHIKILQDNIRHLKCSDVMRKYSPTGEAASVQK